MARAAKLTGIVFVLAFLTVPGLGAQTATEMSDAVVVDMPGSLRLVDAADGSEQWRLETGDGIAGGLAGGLAVGEMIYASVVEADGERTAVYAAPGADPELIGHVPGRALVKAVAGDGAELVLIELPAPDVDGLIGSPTGVARVPLTERWRPDAAGPVAQRAIGFGVLAPDEHHWYELRRQDAGQSQSLPTELELAILDLVADETANVATLPLSGVSGYHSLLLAPAGERLYVVDYFAQSILGIDPRQPAVVGVVGIGRYSTKRPPCAAALSPQGDRLYVLGNNGPTNAGDGILVYETASLRLVDHYLPGEDYNCLALSPDGERLYATELNLVGGSITATATDPWLATIDAATGRELSRVPLNLGYCCAFLVAVAGGSEVVLPA